MTDKTIVLFLAIILFSSCGNENNDAQQNESSTDFNGEVISYQCSEFNVLVKENSSEAIIVNWDDKMDSTKQISLTQNTSFNNKVWQNGEYSLSDFENYIEFRRPNFPITYCFKGNLSFVFPETKKILNNPFGIWVEDIQDIDKLCEKINPVNLMLEKQRNNPGLEPIKIYFLGEKIIKIYSPEVNKVGASYYLWEEKPGYVITSDSKYVFDKQGNLLKWTSLQGEEFNVSQNDIRTRKESILEEANQYIEMAKILK